MAEEPYSKSDIKDFVSITIRKIQEASDIISETSLLPSDLLQQYNDVVQWLSLVKEEDAFQTYGAMRQAEHLVDNAENIADVVEYGGNVDDLLNRFNHAKDTLIKHICSTPVGIVKEQGFFYVRFNDLRKANEKLLVKLGHSLILADRLEGKHSHQTDAGMIRLDEADLEGLFLDNEGERVDIPDVNPYFLVGRYCGAARFAYDGPGWR